MCDDKKHCDAGEDEEGCENKTGFECKELSSDRTITIPNYHRCTKPGMSYVDGACEGYTDQMNCSLTNTIECTVKDYQNTRVRDKWVCNNNKMCDGGEDEECITFNDECRVHKHRLCDGIKDCTHGEDEINPLCDDQHMTNEVMCQRLLRGDQEEELGIPIPWLCDGFKDCLNGADEDKSRWMICGSGEETRCFPKQSHQSCNTGFICPDKTNTFVPFEYLCDYEESCGGSETQFCKLTKEADQLSALVVDREQHRYIAPCLPGMIDGGNFECQAIPHRAMVYLAGYHMVHVLKEPQTCGNIFGEQYILMLCDGLCTENVTCPLTKASYTQCIRNIVYVMDDDAQVQKVAHSSDRYDEHVFVCENRKCLEKDKVCNLVDDCGDGSDEKDCVNSFKCETGSPKYVKLEQVCDGVHDCQESSDECSRCEKKQIIQGTLMKCCTLAIGLCSIFVNIYMIRKFVQENKFLQTRSHFLNLSLVVLISMGDFCVGIYLINVFVMDQVYNSTYCQDMYDWLTSRHCAFLGVLGTFGTQLSILTMTCLSAYRAMNLRTVAGRARVTQEHKMYMISLAGCLIFVSLLIGVLPILDWTEDYFTNGMFYKTNTLFNKVANLDVHKNMINLYRRLKNESENDSYTWTQVRTELRKGKAGEGGIFTEDYEPEGVIGKSLKFYGNDGVCLFKYFVSPDDPQRIYSLLVLFLDLLCFILISLTYGFVILTAHGSNSKTIAKTESAIKVRKGLARNTRLQTKISMMILSNFLCWVPFSAICILHTLSKIDATPYYKISSIVLLPINSCVNPIIYSNIIGDFVSWVRSCCGSGDGGEDSKIDKFKDSISNSFRDSIRHKGSASNRMTVSQVQADTNDVLAGNGKRFSISLPWGTGRRKSSLQVSSGARKSSYVQNGGQMSPGTLTGRKGNPRVPHMGPRKASRQFTETQKHAHK